MIHVIYVCLCVCMCACVYAGLYCKTHKWEREKEKVSIKGKNSKQEK